MKLSNLCDADRKFATWVSENWKRDLLWTRGKIDRESLDVARRAYGRAWVREGWVSKVNHAN
jgi:hypothetical protein